MHLRMRAKLAVALLPAVATILFLPGIASAHEQYDVGPIHMEVGFGTEPTYIGQPNSVQLLLTRNSDGKPILDLGDTLSVTVSFGGQTTDAFPIVPNFEPGGDGIQGDYRAWFVPTQAGAYTFHFTGTVDGTKVDHSFVGGPKTFSTVEDMSSITFPKVVFPANNELAARIESDSARTLSALAGAAKSVTDAKTEASDAKSAASTARTIAIIGVLVGIAGLAIGITALSSARKRTSVA
ncbi:MAG: hypothetical protein ACRDH7_00075 [Actinomycetota bacterium]